MYKNIYNTQFYFIKEKHFRVYSQLWAGVQFIYFYAQQKKKKTELQVYKTSTFYGIPKKSLQFLCVKISVMEI